MAPDEIKRRLLDGLTEAQAASVQSDKRRILVAAGAGSGKTEVMARRIAWWVGVDGIPKDSVVAFTFTKKAADEMKFRVRRWIGAITPPGEDVKLGGMYVGTIHSFCLARIREYWPDDYHNYDILDEASRAAFILRGFNGVLGLRRLQAVLGVSQSATVDQFITAYDQLHEHNRFDVRLPKEEPPLRLGPEEREWCLDAALLTDVGDDEAAQAFALSAARYYAYLRCRRFLDFSTSQTEFLGRLRSDGDVLRSLAQSGLHLVVDEAQDINPVQRDLVRTLVGDVGKLTAVGDHRQSIYGFRGAKVELIGDMWNEFNAAPDAEVVDLRHNFRSTPRVIEIANQWAATITPAGGMQTPPMLHGKEDRTDTHPSHVALVRFPARPEEASWIAQAVKVLIPSGEIGAEHDRRDGSKRGLALSDVAILVRSATDVRMYMDALEKAGIPSIVRAGPDLFSQPEVLLLIAALALSAGIDTFYGSDHNSKSLPRRISDVLGAAPEPEAVLKAASAVLRRGGLRFTEKAENRLLLAARALHAKISDEYTWNKAEVASLRAHGLREFLTNGGPVRRVFPQKIFHWLLSEAEVEGWDVCSGRGETAMFHLGALSGLITGIETPGWTSASDYMWQIVGLCQYGSEDGRTPEQPLIVQPDAVTISTIHGVKGLEFAAVFVADVCSRRFPSQLAKKRVHVPLSGPIVNDIDIAGLSDNDNVDGERRLMYVALTRAERFLVISSSGKKTSQFMKELPDMVTRAGGTVTNDSAALLNQIAHAPVQFSREIQLATSFSDLRYYLGCPHDYYLRKVLGFSPTIDQAFGYGRGVHNLMRAVHSNPEQWAGLAGGREDLVKAINKLIQRGLFYLRYTTGDPADNMRRKGARIVADYIQYFADELRNLTFEPEKEFETMIEYEDGRGGAMVAGAIDIVRRDDPPRVALIDFKSGDSDSDSHQTLDEEEMQLQVGVYAIAARSELEYEPGKGLVRYLDVDRNAGGRHELEVPLGADAIESAKRTVMRTATAIRDRQFKSGPRKPGRNGANRCGTCDFLGFCGIEQAVAFKGKNPGHF